MTAMSQALSLDEVVERGKALYEERLRSALEKGNTGQYLVIDIATGEYEIDSDHLDAARRARAKHPNADLFGMRIGYPATDAIGATLRPIQENKNA